jgi:hypothetical protein
LSIRAGTRRFFKTSSALVDKSRCSVGSFDPLELSPFGICQARHPRIHVLLPRES